MLVDFANNFDYHFRNLKSTVKHSKNEQTNKITEITGFSAPATVDYLQATNYIQAAKETDIKKACATHLCCRARDVANVMIDSGFKTGCNDGKGKRYCRLRIDGIFEPVKFKWAQESHMSPPAV